MMNDKIIGIAIIIVIGVGIVYAVSNSSLDVYESNVEIESSIDLDYNSLSTPVISDDAIIDVENQNYDVNEDGKRHYTLIANTEPSVSNP